MIAAVLTNGVAVEVDDSHAGIAQVTSLGRECIGQSYVGGLGYVSTKFAAVEPAALVAVAQFEECAELTVWQNAMAESDALADEHCSAVAAALEIEDAAKKAFIQFIHTHSVARGTHAREIAPQFPQSIPNSTPPASLFVEDWIENVYPEALAL